MLGLWSVWSHSTGLLCLLQPGSPCRRLDAIFESCRLMNEFLRQGASQGTPLQENERSCARKKHIQQNMAGLGGTQSPAGRAGSTRQMRAGKCWKALGTQQHFKESQHHGVSWVGWDPQGSSQSNFWPCTGLLNGKPTHFSTAAPSKGNWFMALAFLNWMLPYEWCRLFLMLPDAFSPSSWMVLCTAPFYSMYTFPRVFCEDLSCLEAEGAQSIYMPSQSPVASSSLLGTPPSNRSKSEKVK